MAKSRYIQTRFWSDPFVVDLKPLERYMFLYFLTNPDTNTCGMYELAEKKLQNETGLSKSKIDEIMVRLSPKIRYVNNWILIKNFEKNQAFSDDAKKGIERQKNELPDWVKTEMGRWVDGPETEGSHPPLSESKSESELKSKTKAHAVVGFSSFWESYPRKVSKKPAEKAWTKISPSVETQALISSALEVQKRSDQWRKDDGRFIPHAATWLNQERWTDEVSKPTIISKPNIPKKIADWERDRTPEEIEHSKELARKMAAEKEKMFGKVPLKETNK